MRLGLDYAGARPGGAAIAATGYAFVVRYLSDGGPSLPGKLLTPAEAADLRTHGVDIVANWETTADRMRSGHAAGVDDARRALAQMTACGAPATAPVYFSADWDATPADQGPIDAYLDGAASVLGRHRVGIYGGYWPVSRALDAGKAAYAWQTGAWSGGNRDPRANLYQRIGFVWVGGVQCDVNEAHTPDYGQWSKHSATQQESDTMNPAQARQLQEIWDQLRGPGGTGWPQLGGRTIVDALALIGEHLGLSGFDAATGGK